MAVSKKAKRAATLHSKANNMSSSNDDGGDKDGDGSVSADLEGVSINKQQRWQQQQADRIECQPKQQIA